MHLLREEEDSNKKPTLLICMGNGSEWKAPLIGEPIFWLIKPQVKIYPNGQKTSVISIVLDQFNKFPFTDHSRYLPDLSYTFSVSLSLFLWILLSPILQITTTHRSLLACAVCVIYLSLSHPCTYVGLPICGSCLSVSSPPLSPSPHHHRISKSSRK